MDTRTEEIISEAEMHRRIKASEGKADTAMLQRIKAAEEARDEGRRYIPLSHFTPEQMAELRSMTPAERIAAKVRRTGPFAAQPRHGVAEPEKVESV